MRAFFLLLLLAPTLCFGQTKSDSLLNVWSDVSQPDNLRFKAINELSQLFINSNPDSALFFAKQHYNFAKKQTLKIELANAFRMQGAIWETKGAYAKALGSYKQSLDLYEELKDTLGVLGIQCSYAFIYRRQGNVLDALDQSHQILSFIQMNKGGDYKDYENNCFNSLGLIYRDLAEFEKAKYYFKQIMLHAKDTARLSSVCNNLGTVYISQNKLDSSIFYFNQSLEYSKTVNNKNNYAICLGNLGDVYKRLNDTLRSLEFYKMSLKTSKEIKNKGNEAIVILSMGDYYLKFGSIDSALIYGNAGLAIAKEIGFLGVISKSAQLLHQISKHKEESSLALEMHELYIDTRDSIMRLEKHREVVRKEFNAKYNLDLENQREKDNSKHEREIIVLVLVFLALIFLLVFFVKRRQLKDIAERKRLLQEIELLKKEAIFSIVASPDKKLDLTLNKEKIETTIDAKLNPTDWTILNLIFENPSMTNKEIAASVSLSYDGASSSLRKMYRLFDLNVTKNHKMALVIKATRISEGISEN